MKTEDTTRIQEHECDCEHGHKHEHKHEYKHEHEHKHEPEENEFEEADHSCGCGHDHDHTHSGGSGKIAQLAIGAIIFAAGIVLEYVFDLHVYITAALFIASYIILGGEIVLRAVKNIAKGKVFDENFLMSAATIGAFAIGEFPEAVAVMLFYQVGEYFQGAAVRKSKKSISDLMDIRPDYANLQKYGEIIKVALDIVSVGDRILVKPGEKIPLDGVIIEGESLLDTKSLTGESLPRSVAVGDTVLSGCVNQNGLLTIEVTKPFGESTVSKIIDLVENANSKKAPTENFITTFARYYTPVVVALATMLAVLPPLIIGGDWSQWVHRGLVFLVISCPCALVISIPLGFFGGIGGASRKGILVKGGNYLEALNSLDIVVFDKTGTLTKGVFEVIKINSENGFSDERILEIAAYAESYSNHPVALSIMKAYREVVNKGKTSELDEADKESRLSEYANTTDKSKPSDNSELIDNRRLSDYMEIAGHGVSVMLDGKIVLIGNDKLMESKGISFTESTETGTKVYVALDGQYAGSIIISDEVKPDSRETILALKAKGIKTAMLTGDNAQIADKIAKDLSLDEVYAGLLPHEKVEKLEDLYANKSPKGKLAFVGDGINDAPVLARADIGIAMGGLGSDAAIEAADVVLMTDEPSKLTEALKIAHFTKRVVWQNIIFALGVKGIVLLLGAFGIATMWEAVFADVGVSLLAVLNAMRVLKSNAHKYLLK